MPLRPDHLLQSIGVGIRIWLPFLYQSAWLSSYASYFDFLYMFVLWKKLQTSSEIRTPRHGNSIHGLAILVGIGLALYWCCKMLQDWVPYLRYMPIGKHKGVALCEWQEFEALISDPIFGCSDQHGIYPTPPARRSPTATATLTMLAVVWVIQMILILWVMPFSRLQY